MPPRPIHDKPTVASRHSRKPAKLTVENASAAAIDLHWITPQGIRRKQATIQPGQSRPFNTSVGHVFVAESRDGKLHRIITIDSDEGVVRLNAE